MLMFMVLVLSGLRVLMVEVIRLGARWMRRVCSLID